jgi:hypothetical protein
MFWCKQRKNFVISLRPSDVKNKQQSAKYVLSIAKKQRFGKLHKWFIKSRFQGVYSSLARDAVMLSIHS